MFGSCLREVSEERARVFASSRMSELGLTERTYESAEACLLWAILKDSIDMYMRYAAARDRRGQRVYNDTREWIMKDDLTRLCSFINICYVFGVAPDYIRDGLVRWRTEYAPTSQEQAA